MSWTMEYPFLTTLPVYVDFVDRNMESIACRAFNEETGLFFPMDVEFTIRFQFWKDMNILSAMINGYDIPKEWCSIDNIGRTCIKLIPFPQTSVYYAHRNVPFKIEFEESCFFIFDLHFNFVARNTYYQAVYEPAKMLNYIHFELFNLHSRAETEFCYLTPKFYHIITKENLHRN